MTSEAAIFDDMDMVGGGGQGVDYDEVTGQTQVEIVDPGHLMAAGLVAHSPKLTHRAIRSRSAGRATACGNPSRKSLSCEGC